jgi:general secretion pathway protein A
MYESRFGISGPPFQLSPDPSFYFDSRGHHRARSALRRALFEDVGLIVVTGEVGAGKTTLVRTLLGELDERARAVAHVVSTQLNAEDLVTAVLIGFGIPPEGAPQDELMSRLDHLLSRLASEARRAVLIVDEAQNLGPDAFQQLAAIVASISLPQPPLQVCLVGQPELRSMLETAPMQYLRELIGMSFHLGPIERDEAGPYIEHRLRCVGWSQTPSFEPAAFDEIYRWTSGVPRRMNLLCNRLLLSCFLNAETNIDAEKVAHTARELRAEIGEPPLEEPAVDLRRPEESPTHQGALPRVSRPAPLHAPALPDSMTASAETGPLLCVAAGYSDHIKAAALLRALGGREVTRAKLVSVYNDDAFEISRGLFHGSGVDTSMIHLGITRDGESALSELMKVFRFVVDHVLPRAVVVFNGSESALVCSSVASGKDIPVIHVGAGLRVHRAVEAGQVARQSIDELADLLYTTDAQASETLASEGIAAERVHCVGNLLVDALQIASQIQPGAAADRERLSVAAPYLVNRSGYGLVVINQPLNIDSRQSLQDCLAVLHDVSRDLQLVWPMHRVTEARLKRFQLYESLVEDRITCLPPQPYADYVALLRAATCVLTDSWSVQEEATALGIPCITLGRHPERAITVTVGSNIPVGSNHAFAARVVWECIFNGGKRGRVPELWDGKTAGRIASYLRAWLSCNTEHPPDVVAGSRTRGEELEPSSSSPKSLLSGH